jgi:demethylmenaquinone methyltransferase/2-methoxy-6-polyprenyl-1,4-benzoquinol methylase
MHPGQELARRFFSGTSSSYDRVVRITTFGQDNQWKKAILEMIPRNNHAVLDLACGTGILSLGIAKKVGSVTGIDLIQKSVAIARVKAESSNIENASFIVSAAETIPHSEKQFDLVTSSYLPKYGDLEIIVAEMARVLKPNGRIVMHDFVYPSNSLMRFFWKAYFGVLRVAGRFVPSWKGVLHELDGVIYRSRWIEELGSALARNQFVDIKIRRLTFGTAAIVSARLG